MKRAVSIQVQAIDTEYGFTIVNVCNVYTGEKIASVVITEEGGKAQVEVKQENE